MKNRISKFPRNKWIQGLFAILIAVLTFLIITLPISFRPTPALLEIGDVAFQDITAPRPLSFTSQNLTEQAMDEAEKLVSPVYLPADPEISQKQVESLNSYLSYVSSIRNDEFSSQEEKITDILSSEMAEVDEEIASQMLRSGG